jgi:hypothetical protein
MTQEQWILDRLKIGPLTPIEALEGSGCLRLAARIEDLRRKGHEITTEMVEKNGKRFARYRLQKEKA